MTMLTSTALNQSIELLTLPDSARVWMYTAQRVLTDAECKAIEGALSHFRLTWAAHGKMLSSQSVVLLNQVVVIAVDESVQPATGCSIDSSVAFLHELNKVSASLSDLDLLDRGWVIFKTAEKGGLWERAKLHDFWAMRKAEVLSDETEILDLTLTTLRELRFEGVKKLGVSWHAQMW